MFKIFKRKGGKAEPEAPRKPPSDAGAPERTSVDSRSPENSPTNDTLRKDVVNLLIPETNYNQKSGVGAIFEIMAGKRKKNKRKTARAESCRVSPQKETPCNLQRSLSDCDTKLKDDVAARNTPAQSTDADPAEFVKALVLQKYARPEKHVSLVYVSDAPDDSEKRHAEALLREIARSIDCTIDEIKDMGANDSKQHVYETVDDTHTTNNNNYKAELQGELEKLLEKENDDKVSLDSKDEESPAFKKKSNLKLPKSDTEGCSDDDRSDCEKKRVTFRKHIIFDDGEQQTDDDNSSFESLTSEEDEEYLEDSLPDNDELLGGVVVSRNENENKTIININENEEPLTIEVVDELKRISSDNSDSGFIDSDKQDDETSVVKSESESESESEVSECEEEIIEIIEEEISVEFDDTEDAEDDTKTLVSQESKFQTQVATLAELADTRSGEAERARDLIAAYRKEIEHRDQEIEQLKCSLASAYKESELVRQRSRSLEEELGAARSCSADLADQLQRRNDESLRQLRAELEDALTRRAELESRVLALERDRERLEQEKALSEQKAQEAIAAAEASTAKWRAAHEAARSQAAARAELMLADCEWKMRELEKRAREEEKQKKQLAATVEELKAAPPTPAQLAELTQLRGLVSEQQRSVEALTLQLQKVETREEALKLEVHRLKELLDREIRIKEDKEQRHHQTIQRLEQQHSKAVETLRSEHATSAAMARAALERSHAERTRAALAQLRGEAEKDGRNADRKLREVTTKFESLKEEMATKQSEYETAIAQANSKADWDIMQLRHLLDRADMTHAKTVERLQEKFDQEKESLIAEWTEKLRLVETEAASAAGEAKKLLESTRSSLIAEKNDLLNKMRDQHRQEMDEQWEQFMSDKEICLERMKAECRQEGEEDRVKREKELLEEIAELKSQIQSKNVDFDTLTDKAAQCGRTLEVTEQELREALSRERGLREKRGEDATKMKQLERASKDQVEHLQRKCACLRKLFDDIRTRLSAKERVAEQEAKAKEKELHQLRAEVARLTKILVEESSPKLEARTRADGCETEPSNESFLAAAAPRACETQPNAPRRKGGTLRTPEFPRKRLPLPELAPLPPEARRSAVEIQNGRRRARSVDLPAVQVPVRIKQLEEKNRD
ncbi:myosin-7B [Cydia amplana]|uniref:myosin-7B n=1 Tax=Cydia amplana TaxID=1869771 RepID=UPI002FE6AFDA